MLVPTTTLSVLEVRLTTVPPSVHAQFVPFARQTDWPEMERVLRSKDEPEAAVKARFVVVAFVDVVFAK